MAATGQGEPVTKETRWYTKEGVRLAIYEADLNQRIHVAWISVPKTEGESSRPKYKFHYMVSKYVPVLRVIIRHRADGGFRAAVPQLLPAAKNVVSVRAMYERFDDSDLEFPPRGL